MSDIECCVWVFWKTFEQKAFFFFNNLANYQTITNLVL